MPGGQLRLQGAVDIAFAAEDGQARLGGEQLCGQRAVVLVGRGEGEVDDQAARADQQMPLEAVGVLLLGRASPAR